MKVKCAILAVLAGVAVAAPAENPGLIRREIIFPGGPSAQPKQKQIYEELEDGRLCFEKLSINRRLQAYGVPEKERQNLGLPTRNLDNISDKDRACYQPQTLSDLVLRYGLSDEVRNTLGISKTKPTSVGPTEASSKTPPNPRSPEKPFIVYRGDSRSPEEIQALGGIPPRFVGEITNQSYSLKAHHEAADKKIATRYTSTTRSFGVAAVYATGLYHGGTNKDGYVYRIHPTPNMIDLKSSNFTLQYSFEEELSATGGIRWDQIEAWIRVPADTIHPYRDQRTTVELYQDIREFDFFLKDHGDWKWNDTGAYNTEYDQYSSSEGQPQLAGDDENLAKFGEKTLEQWAFEFMEENGVAVGWNGNFPLDPRWTSSPSTTTTTPPSEEG